MKKQIAPNWQKLIEEIKTEGISSLEGYLSASRRDLFEIYKGSGKNWFSAVTAAGLMEMGTSAFGDALLKTVPRLLHIDDNVRLVGFSNLISENGKSWKDMSRHERCLASMFFWNLFDDGRNPLNGIEWNSIDEALDAIRGAKAFRWELENLFDALTARIKLVGIPFDLVSGEHPFLLHATYSRSELLGGLGYGRLPGTSIFSDGPRRTVKGAVAGVYFIPPANLDVFFVNLLKAETISDSIKYHDYAISPTLFHWDSQSATSVESETGQRYITQRDSGRDILIAVREKATGPNGTLAFKLFGTADYLKHEGSKPISIWWQLRAPIDPDAFEMAAAAKVS